MNSNLDWNLYLLLEANLCQGRLPATTLGHLEISRVFGSFGFHDAVNLARQWGGCTRLSCSEQGQESVISGVKEVMKLSRLWPPSVFPANRFQKVCSGADRHQKERRCPWQVGHKEDYHLLVGLWRCRRKAQNTKAQETRGYNAALK